MSEDKVTMPAAEYRELVREVAVQTETAANARDEIKRLRDEIERLRAAAAPVEQYPWAIGTTYDGYVIAEGRSVPDDWEARERWGQWVAGEFWIGAHLVVCRPVQAPATERVPAWEARGRKLPDGHKVDCGVQRYNGGSWYVVASGGVTEADADGMVEVLTLDGEA